MNTPLDYQNPMTVRTQGLMYQSFWNSSNCDQKSEMKEEIVVNNYIR